MTIKLKPSTEESTYIVTVSFYDAGRVAVAPKLAQWTLKDEDGAIVNGHEAVNLDVPGTTVTIVLTGDDLALPDPNKPLRYLLIEAVYDSVLHGPDLNLREEGIFSVSDLISKTPGPVIDPADYGMTLGQLEAHLATTFEAAGAISTHAAVTSSVHGISSFGATLVDDANANAARSTLGLDKAVVSDTAGITGADQITNIISLTQAEYAAIGSPSATTLYVVTG